MIRTLYLVLLFLLTGTLGAVAQSGSPHFAPFEPFIGTTWRGEFANSTPENPIVDISRWELALNGKALRIRHSVNDGAYGGETIVMWDPARNALVFHYFTTAGHFTTGTITASGGKYQSHEYVTGNDDGVTEVKGSGEILPDGRLRSRSMFRKNGEWVDGFEVIYVEDPAARVVLD